MSIATSLDQMARRLDTYQQQLTALSLALGGLREMSDDLIVALQADSAAVAEQLQLVQAASIDDAPANDADEVTPSFLVSADHDAEEVETATEPVTFTAIDPDEAIEAGDIDVTHDLPVQDGAAISSIVADAELTAGTADEATLSELAGKCEPSGIAEITAALAQVAQIATSSSAPAIEAEIAASETAAINDQQVEIQPVAEAAAETAIVAAQPPIFADVTAEAPQIADTTDATTADATPAAGAAEATVTNEAASNVVDLAAKRHKRFGTPVRRAAAIAAMLVITAGATFGFNELMHSELGQRILELGACDAEMVSANRDCAFLSWLTL